jgi:hypothetical protein
MTPPQPNSIDPRAELEAIFARENVTEQESTEYTVSQPRLRRTAHSKRSFTPHIAGGVSEIDLIERAKAHAPAHEQPRYEHLEQVAMIGQYVNRLRDQVLSGGRW